MKNRQHKSERLLRLLRKSDLGQALIELALIVPILALLLLGVVELGRLAYAVIEVSNAAEAAVRYGSTNPTTAQDTTGIQVAAQTDAGNLTLSPTTVTETCGCADGSATGASCGSGGYSCATGAAPVETLSVTTSANFDPVIHLPGLLSTFTIHGYADQKVLY